MAFGIAAQLAEDGDLGLRAVLRGLTASGAALLACVTICAGLVASDWQGFREDGSSWMIPIGLLALGVIVAMECFAAGLLALLLTTGYAIGGNDFAKMTLLEAPVPVYVGESVLVASFVLLFVRSLFSAENEPRAQEYKRLLRWLGGLYIIGLVQAIRGMQFSLVESLRDASIFYYSTWLLFVPLVVRTASSIERSIWFLLATAAGLAVLRLGKGTIDLQFIENQAQISRDLFLGSGIIVGGMLLGRLQFPWRFMMLAFLSLAAYWVIIEQVRAVWVGLAVGLSYACWTLGKSEGRPSQIMWAISGLIGIGLLVVVGLRIAEPDGLQEISDELASIALFNSATGVSGENARMRIEMWMDVVNAIPDIALTGIGFGTPFFLQSLEARGFTDPNPERAGLGRDPIHNSILEIGLRTGLIGLTMFLGVLRLYFAAAHQAIKVLPPGRLKTLAIGIHGSVIMVLVASCFAPLLQVPYIAVPLWLGMGLIIATLNPGLNKRKAVR